MLVLSGCVASISPHFSHLLVVAEVSRKPYCWHIPGESANHNYTAEYGCEEEPGLCKGHTWPKQVSVG
jgi:hypothetical protein